MRWFRRRGSVDVGVYKAPPRTEPPPVERIVEDGVLIADSVLLLTLRNQVIVSALRDRLDLDRTALEKVARLELEALADNEWETAERLRLRRESSRMDEPWPEDIEINEERRIESMRRESVHRAMSAAFSSRAADLGIVSALVERSLAQAWDEVAPVVVDRAEVINRHDAWAPRFDPRYEAERTERLGALLALDLSALAAEHGVELL